MSWWSYERQANGKINYVLTEYSGVLILFMFFTNLGAAYYLTNPQFAVRFLLCSGFACILTAKLSLFRRGTRVSWRTSGMSRGYSSIYRLGYAVIIFAVVLMIISYQFASSEPASFGLTMDSLFKE